MATLLLTSLSIIACKPKEEASQSSLTNQSTVSETTTENSIKTAPNATRNVIISPKTKKANIGANIDSVDISIDALVAVVSL